MATRPAGIVRRLVQNRVGLAAAIVIIACAGISLALLLVPRSGPTKLAPAASSPGTAPFTPPAPTTAGPTGRAANAVVHLTTTTVNGHCRATGAGKDSHTQPMGNAKQIVVLFQVDTQPGSANCRFKVHSVPQPDVIGPVLGTSHFTPSSDGSVPSETLVLTLSTNGVYAVAIGDVVLAVIGFEPHPPVPPNPSSSA